MVWFKCEKTVVLRFSTIPHLVLLRRLKQFLLK